MLKNTLTKKPWIFSAKKVLILLSLAFIFLSIFFFSSSVMILAAAMLSPVGVFIRYTHFIYHVLIKAKLILMPLTHINLFHISLFSFLILVYFFVMDTRKFPLKHFYTSACSLIRAIKHLRIQIIRSKGS